MGNCGVGRKTGGEKKKRRPFRRVVLRIVGSHGPSAAWPVALRDARRKKTGHFGRDDRNLFWEARRGGSERAELKFGHHTTVSKTQWYCGHGAQRCCAPTRRRRDAEGGVGPHRVRDDGGDQESGGCVCGVVVNLAEARGQTEPQGTG